MTYASAGALIRDARGRHRLTQEDLAHRASTTQRHISRIERGEVSPSTETLARLLRAVGERLELRAVPGPRDNRTDADLQADFRELTASERVAQTAALSRSLTAMAASSDAGPLQLEPLLRTLADHDAALVITGDLALSVHGVVRGTDVVELVPEPSERNLRRLHEAVATIDAKRLGRTDIVRGTAGVKRYSRLDANAVETEVPGAGTFRFAGYADLIAMKTAAGRPQDEIDIVSLQRARGTESRNSRP
jgi:transcriptional regulator with XRE-family HTH domain